MLFLDLLCFLLAVYGLSWLLTRARLTATLRSALAPVPLLGHLVQCIVCASGWAAAALALLLPSVSLLSERFVCQTVADGVLLVAAALASTWLVARAVGDAD